MYLGLNFDPCLNWNQFQSCPAHWCTCIVYRVRPFISAGTANTLCKALILLVIDYGSIIWSRLQLATCCFLQRLQNRAGRTLLRCHKRTPIGDIHERLHWSYCQTRSQISCVVVAKYLMGLVPRYLDSVFKFVHETLGLQTRAAESEILSVPFPPKKAFKRMFKYAGAMLWNSLPQDLKMIDNFINFKKHCKLYFMESKLQH